jgi:H+/gluconate symporter-like permease
MSASELIGLAGILIGLGLLIWLAFKGWSVLLLAPLAAMVAALFSREPLLAHWTQTFMRSAAGFLAQFFPMFLLGALFGKLMEDSGSVRAIADFMTQKLGAKRAILAVVLGGAIVTYGGVSLFVAFFVIAPMAQDLFRSAAIPRRLMPAAIMLAACRTEVCGWSSDGFLRFAAAVDAQSGFVGVRLSLLDRRWSWIDGAPGRAALNRRGRGRTIA